MAGVAPAGHENSDAYPRHLMQHAASGEVGAFEDVARVRPYVQR